MIVDIIIPTSFNPELTNKCIESIFNNIKNIQFQITVIDNLSNPPFVNPNCKVKRYEQRLGFAKAMNEGIRNTTNEYILLLNNDTIISQSSFLTNLIETVSQDDVAIASPMTNFICTAQAKAEDINHITKKVIEHRGHIAAVCWMTKRSVISEIGLFDENYKIGAFEDGDYCQRVLNAGHKIMIDGRCFLFHYGSRTVSQTPGYYEAFQENAGYYRKKWNTK